MFRPLFSLILVFSLLTSCERPSSVRADGKKRILTTFTIIQDIAQNVAGDAAVVDSITKPGAEIHDYEPTPLDLVKAQDADLVLWNGLGLERWFEKFLQQVRDVPSAVVSAGIQPMSIGEGPYNGKANPHAWMSPANAIRYVENIREALVKIDSKNAATYNANAAAYTEKLKAVDSPVRQKLGTLPSAQRWLVSCEGAFSYLARDYGMNELYLWPVNADQEGTPQQVQKVVDTIRRNQIPVVFSESTISDKAMQQVAKETGARFGGVLYVDSLTDASGAAPTYMKLLETNADTIVKAFTDQ
jgi:manganese/iron transport system substrate-binding protein